MIRRRPYHIVWIVAMLAAGAVHCPKPTPVPVNGPPVSLDAATPRDWTDTARMVCALLDVALPFVDRYVQTRPGIDPQIAAGVHRGVAVAMAEALPAFHRAIDVFVARGAVRCADARDDCCLAFQASGALREALVGVARAIVAGGWTTALDIARALDLVGVIADDLAGTCARDSGWTRYGDANRTIVRTIEDAARAAGATLRPFPASVEDHTNP
jgi:hypothetical protein